MLRQVSHRSIIGVLLVSFLLTPSGCSSSVSTSDEPQKTKAPAKHTNRLAKETSPYLLLHAHNPVDWYPWGPEALEKAKAEKKLIFLSVGYSSCHWCHVMERESFMDAEIASFLNRHFICIKVDREERPDIDRIYMSAVQLVSQGRGGWPMSVFMMPDARPFFAGTYFPARDGDRGAHVGFFTLLKRIQEIWNDEPKRIEADAETLTRLVKAEMDGRRPQSLKPLDAKFLARVQAELQEQFDEEHGGFGYNPVNPQRPKFPEPSNLLFLVDRLKHAELSDDQRKEALRMLVGTLQSMASGGIRDHVGGGFHRYSVDRYWQIPHFEKMLYDNGQLATTYAEAYKLTGQENFRRIVEEMLGFVLDEMTSKDGGFYSALDAESEDEEGKFYRWEREAVQKLLKPADYELFAAVYQLDQPPNFEEKYYAPQLSKPLAKLAEDRSISEAELAKRLRPLRRALFDARSKRPRPLTDTKILTSWNGLMIRGFADAGRLLDQPRYIDAAKRAAEFVLKNLRDEDGRLKRTYGEGKAKLNAYLNDYAFLADGLIALHEATGDDRWLKEAVGITDLQLKLFWDEENGGFFFTSDDHESLLARGKNPIDGAQPSGNSVAAQNLIYLGTQLKRPEYISQARKTIDAVSGLLDVSPTAAPRMAIAVRALLATELEE